MHNFKKYLLLEGLEDKDLDMSFIDRVLGLKLVELNFGVDDFFNLKYKREIRDIINRYLFSMDDFDGYISSSDFTATDIQSSINKLKHRNKKAYTKLFEMLNVGRGGFGKGEVLMYYLVDDATLSGHGRPYDLSVGSDKYEVKAIKTDSKGEFVKDFMFGGTINVLRVITNLFDLAEELNIELKDKTSIPTSVINTMRKSSPEKFNLIENEYRKIVASYFAEKQTIFFTSNENKVYGDILAITDVDPNNIFIERYTSNALKPFIKL